MEGATSPFTNDSRTQEKYTQHPTEAHKATRPCSLPTAARQATCNEHTNRRTTPPGNPRPSAGGQQRQDLQQPCGNRSESFPVPKQLNKTSYSMRESLSGALMEYSFVHASANPNDGLP